MSGRRCARSWQVEAVKDQRLSGADRLAFERHRETCGECTLELAAFERLEALGARLPAPSSDPLARRRLRNELLRRANDLSVGSGRPPAQRRSLLFLAAALAAVLLVAVVVLRRGDDTKKALATLREPRFALVSAPGSDWSTLRRGPALRLALRHGEADVSVNKLGAGQSFVLELPDGELEVRGTQFSVRVADRKTLSVKVREGLVALRLREGTGRELLLGAGQAWAMTVAPPPLPVERSAAAPVAPPASASAKSREKGAAAGSAPATSTSATSPAAKKPIASGATEEFAAAMAAYSRGDFATAERLFLAFEQHYPMSGHVEDTTFLRALTRLRRGDEAGGKALAREYLKRYPNGFRHPEAVRITETTP